MVEAETKKYDVICIGAGSGAMGVGRRAALLGKTVAMIENKRIGGTCVNVGCVPKKVMFNLASFLEQTEIIKHYGVDFGEIKLDFPKFKQARDAYVARLNGIYKNNINKQDIDYFEGTGAFESKNIVVTSEGIRLEAPHIMITAGSTPAPAELEGGEFTMNSDDFFDMEELPKKVVVIGGGYIGVEFAQILHALGVDTTLLVRSVPLRFVDEDVRNVLEECINHSGMKLVKGRKHQKITKDEATQELSVHLDDGSILTGDKVIIAIGRPPLVGPLHLENAGVAVNDKGAIIVDDFQNTNVEGIFALGDIIDKVNLTPVAVRAGRILAERLYNNRPTLKMDYENIATVIFSHPPIGTVGVS